MGNEDFLNKIYTPKVIQNDREYYDSLKETFYNYIQYISDNDALKIETEEVKNTKLNCDYILNALKLYFDGNIQDATENIMIILDSFIDSKFVMSSLDDGYAFRLVGRFNELQEIGRNYDQLNTYNLSFFRARPHEIPLTKREELSHIPVNKREMTSTERFCIAGIPCLYLCVSSYACWKELDQPSYGNFYCSAVKIEDKAKKLRVLNLAISMGLILGIGNSDEVRKKVRNDLIKIYPLVLATSFHVEQKDRKFKSEYVISQLIMHCLRKLKIDGVAYMSTKSKGEMDFPLNVCLALPVFDEPTFDTTFEITCPISLENYINIINKEQYKTRSFINGYYNSKEDAIVNLSDVPYFKDSIYSAFDDYLVNQKFESVICKENDGDSA